MLTSRKVVYLQMLGIWKKGDSCLKAQPHISVEQRLLLAGRGEQTGVKGGGCKAALYAGMSTVPSDTARSGLVSVQRPGLVIPAPRHPGSASSWLHG